MALRARGAGRPAARLCTEAADLVAANARLADTGIKELDALLGRVAAPAPPTAWSSTADRPPPARRRRAPASRRACRPADVLLHARHRRQQPLRRAAGRRGRRAQRRQRQHARLHQAAARPRRRHPDPRHPRRARRRHARQRRQVIAIDRLRDLLADLSFRAEAGTSGAADAARRRARPGRGRPRQYPDGAPAALDRFFAAWEQLNSTPQDPAARANVLDTGRQLAAALGSAVGQLAPLSDDTGERMRTGCDEVNVLAKHVAGLNQGISDAVTAGSPRTTCWTSATPRSTGWRRSTGAPCGRADRQVDVYVGNSILVSGVTTRPLAVTQTAAGSASLRRRSRASSAARSARTRGPCRSTCRRSAAARPASRPARDPVNAVHSAGYSLDGDPAGDADGGDFFTGRDDGPLAVRADLTENGVAASATGARGGRHRRPACSPCTTATPRWATCCRACNSRMGAAAANANRDAGAAAAALAGADQRRASANGVNVDEEMVDLVKFQHSYEAAARVISMADGFLDTIINHMGAGR